MLRDPLSADQLRLLQVLFESFDQSGDWPVWQYADITLDQRFGLDAAEVLASLPVAGERSPVSVAYGLAWRTDSYRAPLPDNRVALTVAGLRFLRPAAEPLLGAFLVTIRHMIEVQRKMVPTPDTVVEANVSSETISAELLSASISGLSPPPVKMTLRKVRQLLGHEPFLYGVVTPPLFDGAEGEDWTARVPAILRAYRGIGSIDDYIDRVIEQVAPAQAPSMPPSAGPLDVPAAVGYLDAVWKSKTGSRLFASPDILSASRLTLMCGSEEEFNSLMSALADVLGQVVVPGRVRSPQGGALEKVRDWLTPQVDPDVAERLKVAFATLINLRHLRVSQQHSDARHKAVAAFREIGLAFPPASWDEAWTHVVLLSRGALDVIREEVSAELPDV